MFVLKTIFFILFKIIYLYTVKERSMMKILSILSQIKMTQYTKIPKKKKKNRTTFFFLKIRKTH